MKLGHSPEPRLARLFESSHFLLVVGLFFFPDVITSFIRKRKENHTKIQHYPEFMKVSKCTLLYNYGD